MTGSMTRNEGIYGLAVNGQHVPFLCIIRTLKKQRNVTQGHIIRASGLDRKTIQRSLRGKRPYTITWFLFARYLYALNANMNDAVAAAQFALRTGHSLCCSPDAGWPRA